MKIAMRRTFRGLEPVDPNALRHVKQDEIVTCEVKRPRSIRRHNWFWALVTTAHHNLPEHLAERYPSADMLMDELKVRTGHAELRYTVSGERMVIPKSIAFHALDEDGFKAFCDRALALIAKDYIPGINPDDLRHEIDAQASERRAA